MLVDEKLSFRVWATHDGLIEVEFPETGRVVERTSELAFVFFSLGFFAGHIDKDTIDVKLVETSQQFCIIVESERVPSAQPVTR